MRGVGLGGVSLLVSPTSRGGLGGSRPLFRVAASFVFFCHLKIDHFFDHFLDSFLSSTWPDLGALGTPFGHPKSSKMLLDAS